MPEKKPPRGIHLIQGGLDKEAVKEAFEELRQSLHQELDQLLDDLQEREMLPYLVHWLAVSQEDVYASYSFADTYLTPAEARISLLGALDMAKQYIVTDWYEDRED